MAVNDIKVKIALVDDVSKPIKTVSGNIADATGKIKDTSKSASDGLATLAKSLITFEVARKAVRGLSESLQKVKEFEPTQKKLAATFRDMQFQIGKALLPTVKDLVDNVSQLGGTFKIIGNVIGGTFAGIVASIKGIAAGIYQGLSWITAGIEGIINIADKIPDSLLNPSFAKSIDAAKASISELHKTFKFAAADMGADTIASFQNAGDIFAGKTSGTLKPGNNPKVQAEKEVTKEYRSQWLLQNDFYTAAAEERWKRFNEQQDREKKARQEYMDWEYKTSLEMAQFDDQQSKDAIARAEAERDARLSAAGQFVGGLSQLMAVVGRKSKEAAAAAKALAIVETTINTAQAAMASYKAMAGIPYVGPALGAVAAAGAVAAGAAQIAIIASQKFAGGGIVGGNSYSGDRVPAMLNSGEMVLNQQQQAALFNMANRGASITVSDTIIINGNADASTVREIRKSREDQLQDMRQMMRELKMTGQI